MKFGIAAVRLVEFPMVFDYFLMTAYHLGVYLFLELAVLDQHRVTGPAHAFEGFGVTGINGRATFHAIQGEYISRVV